MQRASGAKCELPKFAAAPKLPRLPPSMKWDVQNYASCELRFGHTQIVNVGCVWHYLASSLPLSSFAVKGRHHIIFFLVWVPWHVKYGGRIVETCHLGLKVDCNLTVLIWLNLPTFPHPHSNPSAIFWPTTTSRCHHDSDPTFPLIDSFWAQIPPPSKINQQIFVSHHQQPAPIGVRVLAHVRPHSWTIA